MRVSRPKSPKFHHWNRSTFELVGATLRPCDSGFAGSLISKTRFAPERGDEGRADAQHADMPPV